MRKIAPLIAGPVLDVAPMQTLHADAAPGHKTSEARLKRTGVRSRRERFTE